ncbi:glycoside hydrolase family 47 protein [Hymenopellis radicata]|nr:glycoside hydrolase family 47 protein [Hymenopellis radicata]
MQLDQLQLDDMPVYRQSPLRVLKNRPQLRNIICAAVVILFIWFCYHGSPPPEARLDVDVPSHVWAERAELVKNAFRHGYHAYEKYAAPHDEILPLSAGYKDNFNGWGVTIFDSLDTLILLGFDSEYERALTMVKNVKFDLRDGEFAPFFETIIRYMGGMLSAYALTGDKILLDRAEELAQKLDPVFDTMSSFPLYGVNPTTGATVGPHIGILAEIASLQMEYSYLAKASGKKIYFDRANRIIRALELADLQYTGGMFPIGWNLRTAQPDDFRLSVGAQADSAHEYLLKQYLLTAKSDKANLEMYIRATTHIINNLLFLSPTRHMLYATDTSTTTHDKSAKPSHIFEHLSCFLPGLLILGVHSLPLNNLASLGIDLNDMAAKGDFGYAGQGYRRLSKWNLRDIHLWAAEGLTETCWLMYADQPTGLAPDEIVMMGKAQSRSGPGISWMDALESWKNSGARGFPPGVGDKKPVVFSEDERLRGAIKGRDYAVKKYPYLLRPETLESLYLMWRVTGDPKWRARAWAIFESIERHTKTPYGYASLRTVEYVPPPKSDDMPSYFFAETLKYLYLMFTNDSAIPLDKWVFNTEGHPLPKFSWTDTEKEMFGIPL